MHTMLPIICPHCESPLTVKVESHKFHGLCPMCQEPIADYINELLNMPNLDNRVDTRNSQHSREIDDSIVDTPHIVHCQFCDEEISSRAKKCKHCGEFIDGHSHISSAPTKNRFHADRYSFWSWHTFFSFRGRISRQRFWCGFIPMAIV
jgi:ribosomal protein L37AE/L43A